MTTDRPEPHGDWESVARYVPELLDRLRDHLWFVTPDMGEVLYSTRAFESLYDLPLQSLYDDPASPIRLGNPDDTGEIRRSFAEQRATPEAREFRIRVSTDAGNDRILRLRTVPIVATDGTFEVLGGLTEDVTERERATAEIERLNDLMTMVLDSTSDSILLITPDDRVGYANRTLRNALGLDLGEETQGRPIAEVMPQRPAMLYDLSEQVRTDGRTRTVSWFEPQHGRWFETTMTKAGDDVLSVSEDRTERREAEARERQWVEATNRAERLDALGRMAGSIAHDVGNLMRLALSGLSEAADALHAGGDATGGLADATHAAERALSVTHQLLAFSRGTETAPHPVSVDAVIASMRTLIERSMGDLVDVRVDLASDSAMVMSDESRLEQLILNLVTNARRAMPDGGRFTVSTRRRPTDPSTGRDESLELIVADTGRGMPPDVVERAFEPFYTTDQAHGTGLGLSTVYSTAVAAGGTVRIDSAVGAGTRIVVDLPVVVGADRPPPSTVLLVDTFGPDSDATLEALEAGGHDVNRLTPSRIVSELDRHPRRYGVVVLDPLVDGGAGIALLRQLRTLHPTTPIVLLSGRTSHADLADGGGVVFVAPPYGHTELLRAVEAASGRNG